MVCVVVTRNGDGDAWRLDSQLAVRLHPLVQLDDVCACSASELLGQYGRSYAPSLARHLPEGRRRDNALSALEAWRARAGVREEREAQQVAEEVFAHLSRNAPKPPTDPGELIRIITEDRRAREGTTLRSLPTSTADKERHMSETAATETEKKPRAARFADDATITVKAAENPKRAGSKSFDVFAKYKDGMTVKEAKEAGISTADLRYDSEHDFISIA